MNWTAGPWSAMLHGLQAAYHPRPGREYTETLAVPEGPVRDWDKRAGTPRGIERSPYNAWWGGNCEEC
jgi:hypothetical protein